MLKLNLKKMFFWSCLIAVAMGVELLARADETAPETQVVGNASFEPRSTIVPMCTDKECAHSQQFWSLVIHAQNKTYELSQAFALGERSAPDSIELRGVMIRPGTRLILEAKVSNVAENYAFVSDVTRVGVVMDANSMDADLPRGDTFPGWNCRSGMEQGLRYFVDVNYRPVLGAGGNYQMSVVAVEGQNPDEQILHSVAHIESAQVKKEKSLLTYEGTAGKTGAALAITQDSRNSDELPSTLKITKYVDSQIPVPLTKQIELRCVPSHGF